jgi:hypothetical protein
MAGQRSERSTGNSSIINDLTSVRDPLPECDLMNIA